MTVIVWDGKTLAADKRATQNGLIRRVTKIERFENELIGFCGDLDECKQYVHWYKNGAFPDTFPECLREGTNCLIVIDSQKRINMYAAGPFGTVLEEEYHAWGSGREFAITALYLGKNATEAVIIASIFQSDCGSGVDTLTWEQ